MRWEDPSVSDGILQQFHFEHNERGLSASNYLNFLFKTAASEIVFLVELKRWSALVFLKKSRIKIIISNFCLFVF